MKENGTFKSMGQKAVFNVGTPFDAIGLFCLQQLVLIVDGNIRQISIIAATKTIPRNCKTRYLEGTYINGVSRQVVIGYKNTAANDNLHFSKSMAGEQKSTARIIICPCCGANNSLVGRTEECKYCGAPIKQRCM